MKSVTARPVTARRTSRPSKLMTRSPEIQKMYGTLSHSPHDATSLMRLLKTSNPPVASGLLDGILSTLTPIVNGDFSRVKVEVITPSKVVLMVSNSPVITAPTRTR